MLEIPGTDNTFGGVSAGSPSVSGNYNSAFGQTALNGVTSGSYNSAFGQNALGGGISTATNNTAVGYQALFSDNTSNNTAVGSGALATDHGGGGNNTAVGYSAAGNVNSTGVTAVGYNAGYYSGNYNTSIGYNAFSASTGGSYNTGIGSNVSFASNITYGTAIGASAIANGNYGIGIGYGATGNSDGVAIGDGANAGVGSIAIGAVSASTAHTAQIGDGNLTKLTTAGQVQTGRGGTSNPGAIIFNDGTTGSGHTTTFNVTTLQTSNISYNLPSILPTAAPPYYMAVDASGNLSWAAGTVSGLSSLTQTAPIAVTNHPTYANVALNYNSTLNLDGSNNLEINLGNANIWTATQTFAPTTDITGIVVQQTSAASPASDIFDVENNGGGTKYLKVDNGGNTYINTGSGIVHSNGSGELTSSAVSLTADISGTLPVANGGTGATTASGARSNLGAAASGANGDITSLTGLTTALPIGEGGTNSSAALSGSSIMISNGTAIVQGAAGTTTTVLHGNASGAPSYSAVGLTTDVSGVLPVANGGTGASSLASANIPTGTGTNNTLTKWTGTNTQGNAAETDDGTTFEVGGSQFAVTEASGNLSTTGTIFAAPTANSAVTATLKATTGTGSPDILDMKNGSSVVASVGATGALTVVPSTDVVSAKIEQTSAASPTSDIADITNNGAGTTYLGVDHSGNVNINTASANTTTIGETGANTSSTTINIGNTGHLKLQNIPTTTVSKFLALDGSNNVIYTTTTSTGGLSLVTHDSTLIGNGQSTPSSNWLGIALDNADRWTNTVSIAPGSGGIAHNVTSLVVKQTNSASPTNDIVDIENAAASETFVSVDKNGNEISSEDLQIGNSAYTAPAGEGHIHGGGAHCTVGLDANSNGNLVGVTQVADDIAGQVMINMAGAFPAPGTQLDIAVEKNYTGTPIVVVSGNDLNSAKAQPYGLYTTIGGVKFIVIGLATPTAGQQYTFNYHVISVQ